MLQVIAMNFCHSLYSPSYCLQPCWIHTNKAPPSTAENLSLDTWLNTADMILAVQWVLFNMLCVHCSFAEGKITQPQHFNMAVSLNSCHMTNPAKQHFILIPNPCIPLIPDPSPIHVHPWSAIQASNSSQQYVLQARPYTQVRIWWNVTSLIPGLSLWGIRILVDCVVVMNPYIMCGLQSIAKQWLIVWPWAAEGDILPTHTACNDGGFRLLCHWANCAL